MLEQMKRLVIDDFNRGIRIDAIVKSIPRDICEKNERKTFVTEVIYDYLILQKRAGKCE